MGRNVPARHELIEIDSLQFLPDNPRVYAVIGELSDFDSLTLDEKQLRIYECLLQEPSVKNLIPEIKRDGGLQDPIIVRNDTRQVIEGNSRLAAYRHLKDESDDDNRWTQIRCLVVKTLTDDQQTRLLGQAHLTGKTDWSAYAKALFCYQWVEIQRKDANDLCKLSGIRVSEIKKFVNVVLLMIKNNDKKLSRFSFYDVLVRNRAISATIDKNPTLKETLLAQIKNNNKAFTAQQLRDHLPTVIAKPRILTKFQKSEISLNDAFDRAKTSHAEQRLKKILDALDDIELDDLERLEHHELRAVEHVLRKIRRKLKRVTEMANTMLLGKSTTKPRASKT